MKKIILPFLLCIFLPLSSHSEDTYLLIEGKKLGTIKKLHYGKDEIIFGYKLMINSEYVR